MKLVSFVCLFACSVAFPQEEVALNFPLKVFDKDNEKEAKILRDDRIHPEGGPYSFDFETENGIKVSEGGQIDEESGSIISSGNIEYPLPNGEIFVLKFVANKNGYHPESPYLPIAPAFPHPIPGFVLDQIAFAELQREQREREQREQEERGRGELNIRREQGVRRQPEQPLLAREEEEEVVEEITEVEETEDEQ